MKDKIRFNIAVLIAGICVLASPVLAPAKDVLTDEKYTTGTHLTIQSGAFENFVTGSKIQIDGGNIGANQIIYSDAFGNIAKTGLSAFARTILDDADGATLRATIGAAGRAVARVADYGAIGDDSTNDTAAMQAAMDAVGSRGTILLDGSKTYKITATLTRSNGQGPINIWGSGGQYGGSAIHMATANTTAISITVNEAGLPAQDNGSSIKNLKVIGPTGNTSGDGIYSVAALHTDFVSVYNFYNGIHMGNGSYFTHLENTMCVSAVNAGLYAVDDPHHNFELHTVRLEGNGYGAYIQSTSNDVEGFTMDGRCTVELNTIAGIYLDGVRTADIRDTYFEQQTSNADDIKIGQVHPCIDVTIQSCWFTAYPGVGLWHINANAVDGLNILGCTLNTSVDGGGDIKKTVNSDRVNIQNSSYHVVSGFITSNMFNLFYQGTGDSSGNAVGYEYVNTYGGAAVGWGIFIDNTYSKGLNFSETNVADGRLFLKRGGNVGIGTTDPQYRLDVQGTGHFLSTVTIDGFLNSAGKITTSAAGAAVGLDTATNNNYAEMRVIRNSVNGGGDHDLFLGFSSGTGSKIHLYSNNAETMTLDAGRSTAHGPVGLQAYTVATLPAGTIGDIAYVTDATSPTYNAALTGGGAVKVPVFYNGTAWVAH